MKKTAILLSLTGFILGVSITMGLSKLPNYNRNSYNDYNLVKKPVIYLYGYNGELVNVKLDFKGTLTCTYPKYDEKKGWSVKAKKDSTLVTEDGRTLNYLYWEGSSNTVYDFKKGFCIKGSDTAEFLEKQLKKLGLTSKESNEFITYWLPSMEGNPYNVIAFQTKAYTDSAKLIVEPSPDRTLRVFMAWYSSNEKVEIEEQNFNIPPRTGKVLVEWGGVEVNPTDYKSKFNRISREPADNQSIIDALTTKSELEIQNILQMVVLKKQAAAQEALKQQQNSLANNNIIAPPVQTGHPFTDKNGARTVFTNEEWERLVNTWIYVGSRSAAEELISHHTISELRAVLNH